jgi:hypothetical protein
MLDMCRFAARGPAACGTELAVLRATIHGTELLTGRADSAIRAAPVQELNHIL